MPITAEQFQRTTGCGRGTALTWAKPIGDACDQYGIHGVRLAAFLAQCGHESAGFTRTVENLNYSAQGLMVTWPSRFNAELAAQLARKPQMIAEHVYSGRMGNGPAGTGDGWRYRGRGLIQVTGKANYEAVGEMLSRHGCPNLIRMPEVLAEPKWAALSAAAYWHDHDLNGLADAGDFDRITRRINGGTNGSADRRARYARAMRALG